MMRIKTIANLINNAKCVYDIGSDHAHLAILLLQLNKTNKIVNIDKNIKPLESGIKNLIKANLLDRTINIKSDGFNQLSESDIILPEWIVISGMGGLTIIEILSKMPNQYKNANFILIPNNNEYALRKWLSENKHKIIYEEIIIENNKYYNLIQTRITKERIDMDELQLNFGPINLTVNSDNFIEFLNFKKKLLVNSKSLDKSIEQKKYYSYIKQALGDKNDN